MARLPTPPAGSTTQIVSQPDRLWNFNGLGALPSPFLGQWGEGQIPASIRRQMLTHPKIYQNVQLLKSAILGDGGRVLPCVPPSHKKFKLASELATVCAFGLRHIQGSWHGTARQLLDCVHECHKVAAKTFRIQESGEYRNYWFHDRLDVLPNESFQFMQDKNGNVVKLSLWRKGKRREYWRERFCVLTFRPINGNIWGTSVLPASYEPWYKDVQIDPEEMAMIAQFGRPTVVVVAPGYGPTGQVPQRVPVMKADGTPDIDPATNQPKTISQEEAIAHSLTAYEAGSILVLPGDSEFQLAQAQNGTDLFRSTREQNARYMAAAILGTDQANESQRQKSTDNSAAAQATVGLGVTDGKRMLEEMVESDIFTDIVRYNYGDAALDYLPLYDLGSGENTRLVGLMNAVSAYVSNGAFDKTQWWEYCSQVGLPLPDPNSEPVVSAPRSSGGAHGNIAPESMPQED
jgi:hypothetical protein